jgi:hypothetical protein
VEVLGPFARVPVAPDGLTNELKIRRMPKHTPKGISDIFVLYGARPCFLEVSGQAHIKRPSNESFKSAQNSREPTTLLYVQSKRCKRWDYNAIQRGVAQWISVRSKAASK